ncbi:hypothetical protein CkaCkLH20_06267 [Colletotrichum karsti]|uniref:Heterokaryon incompatibility domain-containing protein n=1 Tax=Colletotrichum karsti TaxID=1095194 RepID=A0A9P6I5D2_9PEZI|nr:uncharacterized protein CkaCkLH20_06267 [Colletotrichum karsti]KAF9876324.1 hypothetical protein CkaCkLH20_06267 [Colletotrichum karsti]
MSPLYETLYARKIRLLQLLPGSHTDPIRCKLQIADLSNKPEYEALSYTWAQANGDTARSQRVYLGDRYDMLAITVNCANALRRLRSPNRSRMLWVDSICINQENIEERSQQVGIMQYIYATALRVLIYLGEDPEDPNPTTSKPWMFENHGNNLELSQDLVSQPYFTRMWVIQEIASARFAWVLYGSRGARWQDIMISPEVDSTDGGLLIKDDNYRQLVSSHPWLRSVNLPRHRGLDELYQFLTETRGCQASDTRDKVFALLGLFVGARDAGLIPDYSLNKGQVLAGVTASCLLTHPRAWVHCFAMVDRVQSPDMPSWAVNWLSPLHQAHSDLGTIDHARWRDESSRSPDGKVRMKFSRKGALIVQGIPFCRLANCLPSVRLEQVKAGPLGVIRDIFYDPDAHDCLPELQDEIIQKTLIPILLWLSANRLGASTQTLR